MMMNLVFQIALTLTLFWSGALHAHEIDPVCSGIDALSDSYAAFRDVVRETFEDAIEQYNHKSKLERIRRSLGLEKSCNQERILDFLAPRLLGQWPRIRLSLITDPRFQKSTCEKFEDTIYREANVSSQMKRFGCCDPVINMMGVHLGVDKIDHFFGQGFLYYRNYLKLRDVLKVIRQGVEEEENILGLNANSVKSYADLAANIAGMRFWLNVFGEQVGGNRKEFKSLGPYLQCDSGSDEWTFNEEAIDWSEYIDQDWDEAINCSSWDTLENSKIIESAFREKSGGLSCPVIPQECQRLKTKYSPDILPYVLHPRCVDQKSPIHTEKPNQKNWLELKLTIRSIPGVFKGALFPPKVVNESPERNPQK